MADLICAKCKKPILEENAVECPFCWEVYHKECWEDTEICETCRKYNPIYEIVQKQKEVDVQNSQNEESETEYNEIDTDEEMPVEFNGREKPSSHVANMVLFVSNIALVLGVIFGVVFAAYMFIISGTISGIIGAVIGAVVAAVGWVISVLIKGFAELINNSQKNAYYLSKLVEKQEEKDE